MIGKHKPKTDAAAEYHEVPVKSAVYTMLIVVAVVAAPLGWLNLKIGMEGSKIADTTRYSDLVAAVNHDVNTVRQMLASEHVDEKALRNALAPVPMFISPDVLPTSTDVAVKPDTSSLNIEMNGIYWSQTDPIVTINDENYHEGDRIQNHTIIEIRKTEVIFEDPMGDKVIKNFYDYLDKPINKKK